MVNGTKSSVGVDMLARDILIELLYELGEMRLQREDALYISQNTRPTSDETRIIGVPQSNFVG